MIYFRYYEGDMDFDNLLSVLDKIYISIDFCKGFVVGAIISACLVYWLIKISIKSHKEALAAKNENLADIKLRKSTMENELIGIQSKFKILNEDQNFLSNALSEISSDNEVFRNAFLNFNYLIQLEQYLDYLYHIFFIYVLLKDKILLDKEKPNIEPFFWEIRKVQDKIWRETKMIYNTVLSVINKEASFKKIEDNTNYYKNEFYKSLLDIQKRLDPIVIEIVAGPAIISFLKSKYDEEKIKEIHPIPKE